MTRKINLGRYGYQFESVDIGVSDCETKEEAQAEITQWKKELVAALTPKDPFPDVEVNTNNLPH